MKQRYIAIASLTTCLFAANTYAQTTGSEVQRDVNQQQRIEQGLQSGALTTHEAGQLEKQESRIDKTEANALRDGTLSPAEKARIQREQNQVSNDIYRDKHNAQTGNPNSASSERMQADVQRDVNQEKRVEQGVQSGALTNREAGKLENGKTAKAKGYFARSTTASKSDASRWDGDMPSRLHEVYRTSSRGISRPVFRDSIDSILKVFATSPAATP